MHVCNYLCKCICLCVYGSMYVYLYDVYMYPCILMCTYVRMNYIIVYICALSPPVCSRDRIIASHAAIGFDPHQGWNLYFLPRSEIWRDGGSEPLSLVSVPNILWFNTKSLISA